MNAESVVQLVLAGGGTSVAALLFQSFVNRSKNKVDVQVAVNAMAKEWLATANDRLTAAESQSEAWQSKYSTLQTTVFDLRSELFDVKGLLNDMLDDLHDSSHPKAELWQSRFDKIGA